jgi:putative membrane protein
MKWNTKSIPVVSLALLFSATMAFGQQSTTTTRTMNQTNAAPATMPAADAQFAKKAAQADLAEVKMGKLAERNGTGATVKNFGQRMVTDHSAAQQKLESAAARANITLPTTLSPQQQATYDQLSNLHGTQFDRAYAKDMVQDHTKDIAAFQHEANDGRDTPIKNFASQTLPTLQEHLRLAHQMNQKVSAMTTQTGNPHS